MINFQPISSPQTAISLTSPPPIPLPLEIRYMRNKKPDTDTKKLEETTINNNSEDVIEEIARIKELDPKYVEQTCWENTHKFYGLEA